MQQFVSRTPGGHRLKHRENLVAVTGRTQGDSNPGALLIQPVPDGRRPVCVPVLRQEAAGPQLQGCPKLSGITAPDRAGRGRLESLHVDHQAAGRAQHHDIVAQLQQPATRRSQAQRPARHVQRLVKIIRRRGSIKSRPQPLRQHLKVHPMPLRQRQQLN